MLQLVMVVMVGVLLVVALLGYLVVYLVSILIAEVESAPPRNDRPLPMRPRPPRE